MSNILGDIVVLFSLVTFFYTFFRFDLRHNLMIRYFGIISSIILLFVCIVLFPEFHDYHIGPMAPSILWSFVFLYFLFEIKITELVIYGISGWLILSLLELVIEINMVKNSSVDKNIAFGVTILIACILWIFYLLIWRKSANYSFRLSVKMWTVLNIILIILMCMMSFFTQFIIDTLSDKYRLIGIRLSTLGGISLIIFIFSFIILYNRMCESQLKEKITNLMITQQRDYFLQLLSREEETRKFRHDIIGNYVEMQRFCEKEQYDELKSYLNNELGIIEGISKDEFTVGNDVVNSIMNYYLKPMKEKCIIEVNGYLSDDVNIEKRDLCIVFANLISNMAEAVSKMDRGIIRISIEQGKDYIRGILENSFNGTVKYNNIGLPVTSKDDKESHGIGLKNVKDIVKKYDGLFSVSTQDDLFKTEIILKMTV